MSAVLGYISDFVGAAVDWVKTFLTFIVGGSIGTGADAVSYDPQPVLIIFIICLPLVGLGIGLLRRLIKTRG